MGEREALRKGQIGSALITLTYYTYYTNSNSNHTYYTNSNNSNSNNNTSRGLDVRKGTNGVSANGVTANFNVF